MAWIHGSVTWKQHVVFVEEVKHVRRGHPKVSAGRRAMVELDGVELITTKLFPTSREAERHLVDVIADFIEQPPE